MIRTLFLAALVAAAQSNSQSLQFIPAPGSPVVIGKGPVRYRSRISITMAGSIW